MYFLELCSFHNSVIAFKRREQTLNI